MAEVNVQLHSEKAEALFKQFGEYSSVIARRAMNKSIGSAKVVMARLTAKDTGIKVGTVKEVLHVREATAQDLVVKLTASAKRLPLIDFAARGPYPSRGRGRVTYRSLRGTRKTVQGAFIAQMRSGHRGVFKRKAKPRLPIRELFGPSIAHVALKYAKDAETRGQIQLAKNMASEIRYAIREGASKSSS